MGEQWDGPKGPVEELIEKIACVPGVKGVIITDPEGLPPRPVSWGFGRYSIHPLLDGAFVGSTLKS